MRAAIAVFALLLSVNVAAGLGAGVAAYEAGDYETAFNEFKPLAQQGDADAQTNVGFMYRNGQGVLQDYKEALKWYTKAAEQGDADAQTNLGLMYATGAGVFQDNVYAHMWANIGSSNGAKNGGNLRDYVAENMAPEQIAEAQRLARECVKKNYKDC